MTRTRLPLSVILSAAIATSALVLGSLASVQACPLTDSSVSPSQISRLSDRSYNLSDGIRRSGDSERRVSLDPVDVLSIGAVIGLFTIALFYKVRRSRFIAPTEIELLNRYPQLEHPEMALALIPQEALPSTYNTEFVTVL